MKFSHCLPLVTAVLASFVPSAAIPADSLDEAGQIPAGYSIADIEWRGMPDFDKDQVFNGTIHDVMEQMRAIKGPDYTPEFMARNTTDEPSYSTTAGDHIITCGGPDAQPHAIEAGINYLRNLPGTLECSLGPGPRTCGRISCSYNSGIYWCNDKAEASDTYKCSMFGQYAAEIMTACAVYDHDPRVSGLNNDTEYNMAVVVEKGKC